MRTHYLLLAGLLASAVAGSALAQGTGKADTVPSKGIDINGATGGDRGASTGFQSGTAGYSFESGGLGPGASALPPLSPPPPSSAIGNGPPGPPGRARPGGGLQ